MTHLGRSTRDDVWTVIVAILCNVPCALLGCYLVLRRMSLLSDAISHSVLPGLAVAFLLTGSVSGWGMVLGAVVLGIGTAFLTQSVTRLTDVAEDASMGVVFTSLFAVGVLLMTRFAPQVDLDPGCVLYGAIEFAALDTVPQFGLEIPRVVFTLFPALLLTVGFIVLLLERIENRLVRSGPRRGDGISRRADSLSVDGLGRGRDRRFVRGGRFDSRHRHDDRARRHCATADGTDDGHDDLVHDRLDRFGGVRLLGRTATGTRASRE